jgi:hypothetical protein
MNCFLDATKWIAFFLPPNEIAFLLAAIQMASILPPNKEIQVHTSGFEEEQINASYTGGFKTQARRHISKPHT